MSSRRSAFTRIDALAVVAVFGAMAAIATPALVSARENASRSVCARHFKQIGEAIHQYASDHDGVLPMIGGPSTSPPKGTFALTLLPYFGKEELAKGYRSDLEWDDPANAAVIATRLPFLQCPSTPELDRWIGGTSMREHAFKAAPTDYIGISQITMNPAVLAILPPSVTDVSCTLSTSPSDPRTFADVTDGISNTFMGIVEIADKPNRWTGRKVTSDRANTSGTGAWASDGGNAPRGYSWDGSAFPGPCPMNCSNQAAIYSFHPGGCNFLFADGSVRFLDEKMDVYVFYALVTRRGGEILGNEAN